RHPTPALTRRYIKALNSRGGVSNYDIARITFIRRTRELGFSLDEVRGLLALADGSPDACGQVQSLAQHHLDEIEAKIADLKVMQTVLGGLITQCAQGDDIVCPLIASLSNDQQRQSVQMGTKLRT
ncbi:MAG TPA: MerR family DNA-binding protein, partial [Acidiphilium sp.]